MIHHLLIVEDEMTLARNLARAMDRAGIAVQVATNGEEARRALNGGRFDILCSDVRLPDCNGLDLIADIRPCHPGLRVVVMTGQDLPEHRARAEELGAVDFLTKPFPVSRLKAIVLGNAVEGHRVSGPSGGGANKRAVRSWATAVA